MSNSSDRNSEAQCPHVSGAVLQALSVLASGVTTKMNAAPDGLWPNFLTRLCDASQSADARQVQDVVDDMLREGVSDDDIAGRYIPAVARHLGDEWLADRAGFAQVSIGSARLQGLLRYLGPEWCGRDLVATADAPRCLVMVPATDQHTLGATILAGQLRSAGASVQLELDLPTKAARTIIANGDFSALMISATQRISLDSLRFLVDKIRPVKLDMPILIGGNVLDQKIDMRAAIGVDVATNDWNTALRVSTSKAMEIRTASCGSRL
jgi:methylmalonyl-CoA mutase cobalamin-binding subunit